MVTSQYKNVDIYHSISESFRMIKPDKCIKGSKEEKTPFKIVSLPVFAHVVVSLIDTIHRDGVNVYCDDNEWFAIILIDQATKHTITLLPFPMFKI